MECKAVQIHQARVYLKNIAHSILFMIYDTVQELQIGGLVSRVQCPSTQSKGSLIVRVARGATDRVLSCAWLKDDFHLKVAMTFRHDLVPSLHWHWHLTDGQTGPACDGQAGGEHGTNCKELDVFHHRDREK